MKRVVVYSNWCYCDMLDGIILVNGEILRIQWPNGKITKEKVIVESSSYTMMDHGSPCEIGTSKAYVEIKTRGVKCLVRLYGQEILCERTDPPPAKKSKSLIKRK